MTAPSGGNDPRPRPSGNQFDRRHEITDPSGTAWSIRVHWGQPRAGFGLGAKLFPRRRPESPAPVAGAAVDSPSPDPAENPKRVASRWEWLDVLEFLDPLHFA